MFIGRRKELDAMQSLYDKDGFGMMVIYGRRRIGKSTLINEFIKNKNAIFYTATKVGQNRNLLISRVPLFHPQKIFSILLQRNCQIKRLFW